MTRTELNSQVKCHHCGQPMTLLAFREHRCISNQHRRTSKQDWWIARDEVLKAAGQPEAVYGYDVEYVRHDGKTEMFHFAGTEAAARRRAALKRLFLRVASVQPFTYAQYCRAFGIPGSKM